MATKLIVTSHWSFMKLVPNFVVSTKSYFSLKRDCFWGDQFDIVQIFWIAWYEYIFAHLMGCKFFQQMTKPKVMGSLWGLSACGSYQEAQNAPFELYFRFKLHGKTGVTGFAWRLSEYLETVNLRLFSFKPFISTPSKPGLLEFCKDLRKFFDYLDFFVFHLDLSLSSV